MSTFYSLITVRISTLLFVVTYVRENVPRNSSGRAYRPEKFKSLKRMKVKCCGLKLSVIFFLYNSSVAMYFNLIHGLQLTEYKAELIY